MNQRSHALNCQPRGPWSQRMPNEMCVLGNTNPGRSRKAADLIDRPDWLTNYEAKEA
jgi:hypothetical protein